MDDPWHPSWPQIISKMNKHVAFFPMYCKGRKRRIKRVGNFHLPTKISYCWRASDKMMRFGNFILSGKLTLPSQSFDKSRGSYNHAEHEFLELTLLIPCSFCFPGDWRIPFSLEKSPFFSKLRWRCPVPFPARWKRHHPLGKWEIRRDSRYRFPMVVEVFLGGRDEFLNSGTVS